MLPKVSLFTDTLVSAKHVVTPRAVLTRVRRAKLLFLLAVRAFKELWAIAYIGMFFQICRANAFVHARLGCTVIFGDLAFSGVVLFPMRGTSASVRTRGWIAATLGFALASVFAMVEAWVGVAKVFDDLAKLTGREIYVFNLHSLFSP